MAASHRRSRKGVRTFATWLAVLGALMMAFGINASVASASGGTVGPNQPAYWETLPGEQCYKVDVSQQSYTVPAEPEGRNWSKAIIKSGSSESTDGENQVFEPIKAGDVLTRADGKKGSHLILCSVPEPEKPAQPDDKVTYTEWVDGDKSCESKTVTQTRTKTVTTYTWNEEKWEWVATTTTTTETRTRPMTAAELKDCAGDKPDDKVTYTEWVDGDKSCESKTVTQTRTKTVTTYVYSEEQGKWVEGDTTTTTETRTRPMTAAELEECETENPPTFSHQEAVNQGSCTQLVPTVTGSTTTPVDAIGYQIVGAASAVKKIDSHNGGNFSFTLPALQPGETVQFRVVYQFNDAEPLYSEVLTFTAGEDCGSTPPPTEACPSLPGAIFTTDIDGNVINGNVYDAKTDVYLQGGPDQQGAHVPDGTYYVRVTDPSGKVELRPVFTVVVKDGEFPSTPLAPFADTPNNGGEYKVWLSTSPNFEGKCTKTDNFKVKAKVTPPPPPYDECPLIPGNQPVGTDCRPDKPVDVCPDMDGNQPPGTDCSPTPVKPKPKPSPDVKPKPKPVPVTTPDTRPDEVSSDGVGDSSPLIPMGGGLLLIAGLMLAGSRKPAGQDA